VNFSIGCAFLFKIANMGTERRALTLSEKQHIIHGADANKLLTCAEMAKCLGLAPSSLSKIMLVREKILEESKCGSQLYFTLFVLTYSHMMQILLVATVFCFIMI
jgi:hypothetical protein